MQEQEKILEEIEEEREDVDGCSDATGRMLARYWNSCIDVVQEIIRKHMDNDGWIPVEEWMPKENGIYLVTCDDTKFPVKRMRYKKDVEPNGLFYDVYGIYDGKVYAWQPLPEPYRPERSEEE